VDAVAFLAGAAFLVALFVVLFFFVAIYNNSIHRIFSKKNSTPKRGGVEFPRKSSFIT